MTLVEYAGTGPRGVLREIALKGIDRILLSRGFKLPPYFSVRERWGVLHRPPEPDLRNLCRRLLRRGMTVVDVGANVGFLTRHFSRLVGLSGRIFAFEPDPLNFQFLEFNTRSCKNVECVRVAVSDNGEPALLHLNFGSGAGNSLVNQMHSVESVPVSCVSLDEFFVSRGDPQIHVVKIDVEGAEIKVLKGMRRTVGRLPDLQTIIEHCPKNLESAGIGPDAVYDELKGMGFSVASIRKDGRVAHVAAFRDLEPLLNRNGYVNLLCSRAKPN